MSTPDPALLDTDVASVLYRARLFQRVVPAGLVGVVADRPLAISAITLGEASYGALSRKWSARRTAEMLAFYANSFGVVDLGRAVAIEYGRLRAATEALGRPVASNDLWIAASATANGLSLARHPQPTALRATYLARSAAAVTAVHSAEHHGCHERETASGTAGRRHVEVGTLELRCAALPRPRSDGHGLTELRVPLAARDRSCPLRTSGSQCRTDPARTSGVGKTL